MNLETLRTPDNLFGIGRLQHMDSVLDRRVEQELIERSALHAIRCETERLRDHWAAIRTQRKPRNR
jgi:hypothetical protein